MGVDLLRQGWHGKLDLVVVGSKDALTMIEAAEMPEEAHAQAMRELAPFAHESIINPDKYVGKDCRGAKCPKGVMPKSYNSLPAADLTALVDFLSKPKG